MQFVFSAINLGCTKNLVDTQYLLGKIFSEQVKGKQFLYCPEPYDAEVKLVFLNTCGFIASGRNEMFATVDELLEAGKMVCVLGCGLQYFQKLMKDLEIAASSTRNDGDHDTESGDRQKLVEDERVQFLSWGDIKTIDVEKLFGGANSTEFPGFSFPGLPRAYTSLELGYEYVKISEGCNNSCAFCIIPKIRGKQVSQPVDTIVREVRELVSHGAKEVILIAQDTTRYGVDLIEEGRVKSDNFGLIGLLKQIDKIEGEFVYRLLYLYPDVMTMQWFDEMKKLKKFVPYFDLPLQHVSPYLLKRMKRFFDIDRVRQFLATIRKSFPESYIRTNIIIGFPGEKDEHVEELIAFLEEGWFDSVALFEYHDEVLAPSYDLDEKVDGKTIRKRFRRVKDIVEKNTNASVPPLFLTPPPAGHLPLSGEAKGYVEGYKNGKVVVRPWLHAPEIDPVVEVKIEDILENLSRGDGLGLGDLVLYK